MFGGVKMAEINNTHKCGICGISDVRLYRAAGEFFREENVRCKLHVTKEQWGWYVPLIQDYENGGIWGHTSSPENDIKIWESLPDNIG